jgi:hypothetical protein
MSVDLSGEITAIATAVLAVFAIVTAWYARRAFLKQSKEVSDQAEMLRVQSGQLAEQRKINAEQVKVLALQADELRESLAERKREAYDRKRAQASRVFIEEERHSYINDRQVITGGSAWIGLKVMNGSDEPVYEAELRWHLGTAPHGDPDPEPIGTVMPHQDVAKRRVFPQDANLEICGAILTFRDAAGIKWTRSPDGDLTEQPSTIPPPLR